MPTLNPKEFEKAQKIIDVLDSERRNQCVFENNLDSSKIEKFVSQYMKEQGIEMSAESIGSATSLVLSEKKVSEKPLDKIWEEEQELFSYKFFNSSSVKQKLDEDFYSFAGVGVMCFIPAIFFTLLLLLGDNPFSVAQKCMTLFFFILPLFIGSIFSFFKFFKIFNLKNKIKNLSRGEQYVFFRNFLNKKNKMDDSILHKINSLFPSNEIVIDFEDENFKRFIASIPEDSKFHKVLEKWKNTEQPIARFDFFVLCQKFNLL